MDETQYKTLVAFNFYNFEKKKREGKKIKKIFFCVQNCVVSKVYSFLLCHLKFKQLPSFFSDSQHRSYMTFLTAEQENMNFSNFYQSNFSSR